MDEEKVKNGEREQQVAEKAKGILDKFAKALEKIKTEGTKIERKEDRRVEGGKKIAIDRKIMFENAPKKKGDCIEAEKGGWLE